MIFYFRVVFLCLQPTYYPRTFLSPILPILVGYTQSNSGYQNYNFFLINPNFP